MGAGFEMAGAGQQCQSASRTDPPSAANTDPPKVGEMSLRSPLRALQRRSAIAASGSTSDADQHHSRSLPQGSSVEGANALR
jgi:hypothetical protein